MTERRSRGEPVRVLWIAQSCSLQDDRDNPGLTGRMEPLFGRYLPGRVRLAVAYMADGSHEKKLVRGDVEYYAVDADMRVGAPEGAREAMERELLRVIGEFRPDVIQCFGAEWPYGQIALRTDVPVAVHMMGFLNIYHPSILAARGYVPPRPGRIGRLKEKLRGLLRGGRPGEEAPARSEAAELRTMRANRWFFGRTEWDRAVVRYYSPGARYFSIPEVIKPSVYASAGRWRYRGEGRVRLFSLSSGDDRKGNEIILRAADVLKNVVGLDFEWRVAGSREFFPYFEEKSGIRHGDVCVDLIGGIGGAEIVRELESADLFVHPSIMDNSPHAVCEAQTVGCPVIASFVGGVPDLVKDGETGFLYPYNEPHTLAFRIADLCRDGERLTEVSGKAVSAALRRHDPEKIAGMLLEAYETMKEETGRGGA